MGRRMGRRGDWRTAISQRSFLMGIGAVIKSSGSFELPESVRQDRTMLIKHCPIGPTSTTWDLLDVVYTIRRVQV